MKRTFILALVVALSATPLATVEAKKAPKELAFYLHFPSVDGACGAAFMDLQADTPDSGCGYTAQPANEVFHTTGAQAPLTRDWPAAEGFPFKVDVKRPVTAQLPLMSFLGTAAAGQAIVDLKLVGTAKGRSTTLFEESLTLEMVPAVAGSNVAEFEVELPKNLNGKKFTSLIATTSVRGVNNFHYFKLDGEPLAHIVIPTK
ncbi:MAG: hypothetical protein ACR2KQ_03185 [Actinomycetota bacterium]